MYLLRTSYIAPVIPPHIVSPEHPSGPPTIWLLASAHCVDVTVVCFLRSSLPQLSGGPPRLVVWHQSSWCCLSIFWFMSLPHVLRLPVYRLFTSFSAHGFIMCTLRLLLPSRGVTVILPYQPLPFALILLRPPFQPVDRLVRIPSSASHPTATLSCHATLASGLLLRPLRYSPSCDYWDFNWFTWPRYISLGR